ncbi:MAG TPA: hypothetical protein VM305_06680 [Candidatus Limnocylindrales bacterium]|nr:hypothetical protein [Candidatus Limnocylindrales bacterium]
MLYSDIGAIEGIARDLVARNDPAKRALLAQTSSRQAWLERVVREAIKTV